MLIFHDFQLFKINYTYGTIKNYLCNKMPTFLVNKIIIKDLFKKSLFYLDPEPDLDSYWKKSWILIRKNVPTYTDQKH